MRIAMVGNHSQSHCSEVHWASSLEDLGHAVTRIQENEIKPDELVDKVRGHDLFLWVRTWFGFVTLEDLEAIRVLGIPSVNYHLDLFISLQRQDGLDTDPRWRCDYTFTADGDPHSQEIFEQHGINHYWLPPAVFKKEAVLGTPRDEFKQDLIFVGGGSLYAHKEWPYRKQLLNWLQQNYGNRYTKYGHPERTVRNLELNDLYASAKIAIGDSLCLGFTHQNYVSDRLFESVGRGAFTIFPRVPGIEQFLTDSKEIVYYDFNDWDGLHKKINYYLDPAHAEEREVIRLAGHERVKREHTYNNRLQQMMRIVFPPDKWIEIENGGYTNPKLNADLNAFMNKSEIKNVQLEEVSIMSDGSFEVGVSRKKPTHLNLGAGKDIKNGEEWLNLDHLPLPGVQVVHNLVFLPYPFEDEQFEYVQALDVIEHLPNYTPDWKPMIVTFIEEMYRILKPGGTLYMQTPGYNAEFAWQDITHVRAFHPKSFDLFDPDKPFGKTTGFYSKAKFSVRCEILPNKNLRFWLTKRETTEAK